MVTHRGQPLQSSSILSDTLSRGGSGGSSSGVGPFQLGIRPNDYGRGEPVKKWKELSASGKVARATAQTSSLFVILLGGGLAALIVYALATEMGSSNSPTVLYSDACERIKRSQALQQRMPGTYKFHTSPPLQVSERPRHRNRTVSSVIMLDQWGCEHLYLNFWIETTAPSRASLTSWAGFDDWEWTIDHISQWTRHQREVLWKKSRSVFAMLVGESPVSSLPSPKPSPPSPPTTQPKEKKSSWFSLTGLFSSVKSSRVVSETRKSDPVTYTAGEVHVDLVREPGSEYFVYRYLLVDLPNSAARNPARVFIERASDVRENEGVMRFS